MAPNVLERRSSWPSSFATGLIGWIGFSVVAALALGYDGSFGTIALAASLAAVVQVVLLRVTFFSLRLDKRIWLATLWGGVTAAAITGLEALLFEVVRENLITSIVVGVYIGAPVGSFLSYFYRDDRQIESEARDRGVAVGYGRDAHWLDPFVYGAALYLIALLPRTADLAVLAAVVGSITGVFAAGASHFVLSRWNNTPATVPLAASSAPSSVSPPDSSSVASRPTSSTHHSSTERSPAA